MDCEACRSLLSGFLDGALPAGEAERVAAHLAGCEACREELAGLERVDRAVDSLAAPVPPRAYLDEMAARVRLRRDVRVPAPARRAPSLWRRWAPLAAAALVAVAVLRVVDLELPGMVRRVETRRPEPALAPALEPAPGPAPRPESAPPATVLAPAPALPPAGVMRGEGAGAGAAGEVQEKDEARATAPAPASVEAEATAAREAEEKGTAAQSERAEAGEVRPAMPPPPPPGRVTLAAPEALRSLARTKASPDAALRMMVPAGGERDSARERRAELAQEEAAAGPDPAPEVLRSLVAAYAELADRWPATEPGRDAALRAAALAVVLHARTGTESDCLLARARLAALGERYAGDARADSLRAATPPLPCAP